MSAGDGGAGGFGPRKGGLGVSASRASVEDSPVLVGSYVAAMGAFRLADSRVGGGHLYPRVVDYLRGIVAPGLFGVDLVEG
jgi:hypothetical protein